MRQTLCDGYLVIFALAQAVILLMLTPLLRVFPGRYARVCTPAAGRGSGRIIAISTNCLNAEEVAPTSSGLMFRLMPWVLISSMLVLAMALPLFITVSPFAGGGDLITLIYLLALFRFSLLFPGWIPEVRLRESVPVAS